MNLAIGDLVRHRRYSCYTRGKIIAERRGEVYVLWYDMSGGIWTPLRDVEHVHPLAWLAEQAE